MSYKHVFLLICLIKSSFLLSQNFTFSGKIINKDTKLPLSNIEIIDEDDKILDKTNSKGEFSFNSINNKICITVHAEEYFSQTEILSDSYNKIRIELKPLSVELNQIEIKGKRKELYSIIKLKDVEETSIFAGKKSEVILLDELYSSLSLNTSRQIFSQVSGLNIYQNDDAGLQLNVGGRGLDPNRTSNFITRQNGYDISADVLGYPESYYTPPAEAIERIEVVRGAASLQYGTQFGGLINFKLKGAELNSPFKFETRNTVGSNQLFTNFSSVSASKKNFAFYSFVNIKRGNGFRDFSEFNSKNFFSNLKWKVSKKIIVSTDITFLEYLAQQAGGITDDMFLENPFQSNRSRNWFYVNWFLYNTKISHQISKNTNYTLSLFGLNAERNALGFRTNRVDQIDPFLERDLIKGIFKNFGYEYKLIHKSNIKEIKCVSLIGTKLYKSNNSNSQGPGSNNFDADFNFYNEEFPYYNNQSRYTHPNFNISVFGENIFYLSDNFSITPGFRYEFINTKAEGYYKEINLDAAANPIKDTTIYENKYNKRSFLLSGVGLVYKIKDNELYSNLSQNYRSVTFADISVVNPAFMIDPNISDEYGQTFDLGFRGKHNRTISFDITSFLLRYNDRIGFVQRITTDGNVKSVRDNVGNAMIYGVESLINFNLKSFLKESYKLNYFINSSFISSRYTSSEEKSIIGNKVEFIPSTNIKTGLIVGYKNLSSNIQFTYLSDQFTDATNAIESNLGGVIGKIPSYSILDFNLRYSFSKYKLECGINNLLNNRYFTRRATGYPGPGIIPSPPINYFVTLQYNY